MSEGDTTAAMAQPPTEPEAYVPPAIDVLGRVADLTQGPNPGPGDVPTGVISF